MAEYFSMFGQYLPLLLGGLKLTILIAIFGIIIAVVLGIVVCIMQLCHIGILNKIATLYVTIIRGMPLMILALFLYFGVIKNALPLVASASLILGLNASAYLAEIFRGGIQAIDEGQIEAARSLGLSSAKTMRLVFPRH